MQDNDSYDPMIRKLERSEIDTASNLEHVRTTSVFRSVPGPALTARSQPGSRQTLKPLRVAGRARSQRVSGLSIVPEKRTREVIGSTSSTLMLPTDIPTLYCWTLPAFSKLDLVGRRLLTSSSGNAVG